MVASIEDRARIRSLAWLRRSMWIRYHRITGARPFSCIVIRDLRPKDGKENADLIAA